MVTQRASAARDIRDRAHISNINVGKRERLGSLIVGATCIARGLTLGGARGALLMALGGYGLYRGATGHDKLYQALGVNRAVATDKHHVSVPHEQGIRVEQTMNVKRPAEELYRFWRHVENLPRFMSHLHSVTVLDDTHSHWVAKAPVGMSVEWDAEIITESWGEVIGWRSLANSQVANAGSVRFRAMPDGSTDVTVEMEYVPPAGTLGAVVARFFGEEPRVQVADDLRRFKQLMETGQVPTKDTTAREANPPA